MLPGSQGPSSHSPDLLGGSSGIGLTNGSSGNHGYGSPQGSIRNNGYHHSTPATGESASLSSFGNALPHVGTTQQQSSVPTTASSSLYHPMADSHSTSSFPAVSADPAAYARANAFHAAAGMAPGSSGVANNGQDGVGSATGPGQAVGGESFYPLGLPGTSKRPVNPNAPPRLYKCNVCPASFSRNHDLKRHSRIHLAVKPFPCPYCDKSFSRKDALKRHILVKGCGTGNKKSKEDKGKKGKAKGAVAAAASAQNNVGASSPSTSFSDRNPALPNGSVTGAESAQTSPTTSTNMYAHQHPHAEGAPTSEFGFASGGGMSGMHYHGHNGGAGDLYGRAGSGTSSLTINAGGGSADLGRDNASGAMSSAYSAQPSPYGGSIPTRTGLPMSASSGSSSSWYNNPYGGPAGDGSNGSGASAIRSRDSTYETDSAVGGPGGPYGPRSGTPHSHAAYEHHHHHQQAHHGGHHAPHSHMGQSHASPHSHPYSPHSATGPQLNSANMHTGYGSMYAGQQQQPHYPQQQQQQAQQHQHYPSAPGYPQHDALASGGQGAHDPAQTGGPPQGQMQNWWRT
ncbi:hypothetical protein V8E36_004808 [Tilletia maclaganii]